MFSDAMTAGVNPGGLQSRTELRVLICYLLHNSSVPLPLDSVKERLHFEGIANYFETAYAIAELEENGTIRSVEEENGKKYYVSTDECDNIAVTLGNSVPFSVRESALEIADKISDRNRNERENRVLKEKCDNGVYITCSVMDRELELVTVKLLVPDDETAETVKENFLNSPVDVLVNATAGLTGTKI